jgi:hypothetical protein
MAQQAMCGRCEPAALTALRENEGHGKLIKYAWPGGYPVFYLTADGAMLCPDCANGENGSEARTCDGPDDSPWDRQWKIVAGDVYWEGPDEPCAHCGAAIASAYGDPDADDATDREDG